PRRMDGPYLFAPRTRPAPAAISPRGAGGTSSLLRVSQYPASVHCRPATARSVVVRALFGTCAQTRVAAANGPRPCTRRRQQAPSQGLTVRLVGAAKTSVRVCALKRSSFLMTLPGPSSVGGAGVQRPIAAEHPIAANRPA